MAKRPGAESERTLPSGQPARSSRPIGLFMPAAMRRPAGPAPSLTTLPPARCRPIGCATAISTRLPTASTCSFATLPVATWSAGSMTGWTRRTIWLAPDPWTQARTALIEPLRNVYGISDKVLAMALSGILIGAADVRPKWLEVGVQLIAVDTLVHNFLAPDRDIEPVQGSPSLWPWLLPARRLRRYRCPHCPRNRRPCVQPHLPCLLPSVRTARDLAVLQPAGPRHLQRQPAR